MDAVEPKFYNLYLFFFIPLQNQVKGTNRIPALGLENTAQYSIYVALLQNVRGGMRKLSSWK